MSIYGTAEEVSEVYEGLQKKENPKNLIPLKFVNYLDQLEI